MSFPTESFDFRSWWVISQKWTHLPVLKHFKYLGGTFKEDQGSLKEDLGDSKEDPSTF